MVVNDEVELVGVLSHEVGHVTARHSARNYSQPLLADLGLQLGTVLAGLYADGFGFRLGMATGLFFHKFSWDVNSRPVHA